MSYKSRTLVLETEGLNARAHLLLNYTHRLMHFEVVGAFHHARSSPLVQALSAPLPHDRLSFLNLARGRLVPI
jgi:hypothetical protein